MKKKQPVNPVLQRVLARLEIEDKDDLVSMRKELVAKQKQIKQVIKALSRSMIALKRKMDSQESKEIAEDDKLDPKLRQYLLKRMKVLLST